MSTKATAQPFLSPRAKARMWWLKIHRWVGLATLIPMAILGVTGSAQVWPEETEALLNLEREVAATADPSAITEAHITAAREALEPYGAIMQIEAGDDGTALLVTSEPYAEAPFGIGGPVRQQAYVDPDTAEVVDTAPTSGTFMWYMHFIHGLFLIPGWGRQLVGIMGLFLTISAVTGVYIFWPGMKRVKAALKWHKRDGINLNLHRQSGFLLSIVIIVEAITGAWISFPTFFASIVEPGVEQPERRRPRPPQGDLVQVSDADWLSALETAQTAYQGRVTQMNAPMVGSDSWSISMAGANNMTASITLPMGAGELAIEESEARVGPRPPSTRASAVAGTMRRVHYATTGGIIWEILVFLSGIALTFLSISGVYVWAKRKFKRS